MTASHSEEWTEDQAKAVSPWLAILSQAISNATKQGLTIELLAYRDSMRGEIRRFVNIYGDERKCKVEFQPFEPLELIVSRVLTEIQNEGI
ncbi:MAG: hypothetical protein V3S55_03920 [Nitrospiraceae bacterium]